MNCIIFHFFAFSHVFSLLHSSKGKIPASPTAHQAILNTKVEIDHRYLTSDILKHQNCQWPSPKETNQSGQIENIQQFQKYSAITDLDFQSKEFPANQAIETP